MSKYISYIVASLNHDRSLSSLLNPYDRIKALITRYHEKAGGKRLPPGIKRKSKSARHMLPGGFCCSVFTDKLPRAGLAE